MDMEMDMDMDMKMSGEMDMTTMDAPMDMEMDMDMDMNMDMEMEKEMDMEMDPMMKSQMHEAMMTFTVVALMGAIGSGLMAFRYSPTAVYTAASTAMGGTTYQMIDQAHTYVTFAFWTLASIFQLLSFASVATDINMMVWMYGGEAGFFMTLMWMGAMWYFKTQAADNITTSTNVPENTLLLEHIEMQMAHVAASEAMVGFETMKHGDAWGMAQWMMMSEDKQKAWEGSDEDKEYDEEKDEEETEETEEAADETPEVPPTLFKLYKMIHF